MKDYLDYKSGAVLVLNPHIETDVIGTKGKAYGVELLVKKLTGKMNGWISYTYSRTLLKMDDPNAGEVINGGKYYPANYDKPHDVTFIGNYRFTHRFSVSLNATYSTGRPITLPIGRFYYEGSYRTLYADRNAYRIPDYFRTDVSMNIEGNHKIHQRFHNSWTIGVYNVTGRKNPYSVYFVSENGVVNGINFPSLEVLFRLSISMCGFRVGCSICLIFKNFKNQQAVDKMKRWCFLIIITLLFFTCKEAYNPPVSSPATGYLVVEGFINSGNGTVR